MNENQLKQFINLVLFKGEEISLSLISDLINVKEEEILKNFKKIKDMLFDVGLEIIFIEKSKTLQIVSGKDYSNILNSLLKTEIEEDLTPAQLQSVTIIAYLKEVTQEEVSFIRGIQSSMTLRSLSTKGLIKKIADKYCLTIDAFKILGINSNEDLKDFEKINQSLKNKLSETLNG